MEHLSTERGGTLRIIVAGEEQSSRAAALLEAWVADGTLALDPAPTLTVAVVWTPTAGFVVVIPTVGPFPSSTVVRTPTRIPPVAGTVTTSDAPSP